MIEELSSVVLTCDLPDHELKQGDVGTVVMCHGNEGFEVEFITLNGETVAIVSLQTDQLRPIGRHEIAHARLVGNTP